MGTLIPLDRLVRDDDPETSILAAAKARKASRRSLKFIRAVMADGIERTDEEIWIECRKMGFVSSLAVVQHGRLALSETKMLVDTGARRKTSENAMARVWRTTETISRPRMDLPDGAPPNAKKAVSETLKRLVKMELHISIMREKLISMIDSAEADVLSAREHGRMVAEKAAQIRHDALREAMKALF